MIQEWVRSSCRWADGLEKFNEIRRTTVANHLGLSSTKIEFVKHYPCHHYHAFYSKPDRSFDSVIVHAEGDGGLQHGSQPAFEWRPGFIGRTNGFNLGRLYQWMTLYLGMKPYHHEYKLMGLAPHASPWEIEKTLTQFEALFSRRHQTMTIEFDQKPKDLFFTFAERLMGHRFDGIAGALQKLLELRLCEWVECVAQRTNRKCSLRWRRGHEHQGEWHDCEKSCGRQSLCPSVASG